MDCNFSFILVHNPLMNALAKYVWLFSYLKILIFYTRLFELTQKEMQVFLFTLDEKVSELTEKVDNLLKREGML